MADVRGEPYRDDAESLSARLASSLGRSSPRSPSEALRPELVPPPPTRSRAVRHPLVVFLNFVLTMVILGVLAAGGAVFATKVQFEHAGRLDEARSVNIDRGAGLGTIADRLLQEGVISSKWLFMAGVWLDRQQASLKAGEYLIPAHASMRDIMDALVSGRAILYSITIPEGLTSQQIVDCLMADTALSGDRTGGLTERQIEGCRRAAAILTGAISEVPPEGGLLPETYPFGRGDTRQGLIDRMRRDRDRVVADIWSRRAPDLPLSTPAELAVLASIVEKETSLADERSRVAAVFINRLNLNRRLESDPTVIYGLFKGAGKPPGFTLATADLHTPSAYNTYVIAGLPPGPIANPGRAALEAVANPSRTRDLFFVADGSGGHTFAETYEAHLRNVARWREINSAAAAAAEAAAPPADAGAADAGAGDAGAGEAEPSGAADAQTSDPPPPAAAPDASTGSDDKPLQLQPRMRPAQ